MKKLLLICTALGLFTACQTKNPPLSGPPKAPSAKINYNAVETDASGITVEIDPRVDILFVIDDSASMSAHQENLSQNIHRFVDAIARVKTIDFHIGYTVVHDNSRYGAIVPEKCPDGRVNWESAGSLRPLKGPTTSLPTDGRRYVTSQDDFRAVLRDTLDPKINTDLVKPFVNPTPADPSICARGPEEEDLFTPLLRAVDSPVITAGVNKGFRRPGALFVAILVSDAKDASGLTPDDVLAQLRAATGGEDKLRVFAVAIKPGTVIDRSSKTWNVCKPDPAWSLGSRNDGGRDIVVWPGSSWKDENNVTQTRATKVVGKNDNPLAALAQLTENDGSIAEGHVLSICSKNYGEVLAKFGTQIKEDTLRDIVIPLTQSVEITNKPKNQLQVAIGSDVLIKGDKSDPRAQWGHNVQGQSESIVIYAQRVDWDKYPGEKVRVSFTPADFTSTNTKPSWR